MVRMVTDTVRFSSSVRLGDLLDKIPLGIKKEDVEVEAEQYWEYGDEYRRVVISWRREETGNEKLKREREDKLRREAADAAQERKDQEEYSRLSRKYGTSV